MTDNTTADRALAIRARLAAFIGDAPGASSPEALLFSPTDEQRQRVMTIRARLARLLQAN